LHNSLINRRERALFLQYRKEENMGQKDLTEKHLEMYPDVFADTVNALMYGGRRILREEELIPARTETLYRGNAGDLKNQFQDVGMYVTYDGKIKAQYMLENQTKPEKFMPFRKAGYHGAIYRKQCDDKAIYPVVGAVLYWGDKKWGFPDSIKALFDSEGIASEASRYVDNVKLYIYEMAHLSKKVRSRFHSDMRLVVDCLAEGSNYHPTGQKIKHAEALLMLLHALSDSEDYQYIIPEINYGEELTMYDIFGKYIRQGIEQGEKQGIKQGERQGFDEGTTNAIKTVMETMNLSMDKAMDALRIPENKRNYYRTLIG